MVVIADFQGQGRKIRLHAGDEVRVISETDANWWEVATTDGRTGLAPVNYLQPVALTTFRAISAFTGRAGQLSFGKGEELTLVERKNANWFEVTNKRGMRGLAPSNYLEEIGVSADSGEGDGAGTTMRALADFHGSGLKVSLTLGEEVVLVRRKTADWFEVRKADGRRGLAPSSYLEEFVPATVVFRVIADYRGGGTKLNLKYGERLTLVKRVTADWYEVVKSNGERGLAASNYIEEFDGDAGSDKMLRAVADYVGRGGQVSFSKGELMTLCKKLSADWYEVKKANGDRGLAPCTYVNECVVTYTAIADYPGGGHGQLSLTKGEDLVLVSRKNNDWLEVRRANGVVGLAPVTYLQEKIGTEGSSSTPSRFQRAASTRGGPTNPPTPGVPPPALPGAVFGNLPSADERGRVSVERWPESHVLSWLREQPDPAPQVALSPLLSATGVLYSHSICSESVISECVPLTAFA